MLVGKYFICEPPVCTEDLPLADVYEMLSQSRERVVVVVDSQAHRIPIGVVSERSICDQLIGRRRDPRKLTAANVLDGNISKIRRAHLLDPGPGHSTQLALVVDRDHRLVGLYKGRDPDMGVVPHSVTSAEMEMPNITWVA